MKDSKLMNTKRALMGGIIIFSTAASLLVFIVLDGYKSSSEINTTSIISMSSIMLAMLFYSWNMYNKLKKLD